MTARPRNSPDTSQDNSDVLRERLDTITKAYSRFVPRQFLNLLGIEDIRKVELGQQVERKMTVLFADISGYTAFVADTELEHSREILNELLETLVRGLAEHLRIGQIEGDAIFALGTLKRLLRHVEAAFPNARAFRRPGFDTDEEQATD